MMSENNSNVSCSCLPLLFGSVAGFCMSWYFNHSIAWGIFHAICGWFYCAYKTVWYFITSV